ncbi:selenide, water dikinase [Ferroacidibacillus organovorans]|uniref:Selenide, water dikinase n=1 Tax=Ferroacidibacillus organovorans TaxID=1765683 RepID=A0A101XTC2_9BACL|nr:selenide, water dikinase [Ferroacidibacillus organovorans]
MSFLPPTLPNPDLLVGLETSDDAGVYRLSDTLALVQTVDYFTPIVDDPYDFGQIAAANALSDIYAMGGTPLTALNIVGFPISKLPHELLAEILRGGADKVREAGATLLGGHSIDDVDPKFGMAVTGLIDPEKVWTNAGAEANDVLVLTKPIGAGIITKAIKEAVASEAHAQEAIHWMKMLNRSAAEIARRYEVHAVTDVTGFGLLGHALEMARGARRTLLLDADAVPICAGTMEYAKQGLVPAGSKRNLLFVSEATTFAQDVSPDLRTVLADAVTSGGLLLALPAVGAEQLVEALRAAGMTQSAVIGRFSEERVAQIIVARGAQE